MNPETIRALYAERMNAVAELRALDADAAGREFDAEERAKSDRINAAIDAADARIQNGLAVLEREAKADEARSRIEALAPAAKPAAKTSTDADLIGRLVRGEIRSAEFRGQTTDLLAGTATDGAELVPTSMYGQLVQHLIESNVVMAAKATVIRTAGGEDLVIPKTTEYSAASIIAEANAITESTPQFSTVTLGAFKYAFLSQVSGELLSDSAFNVPAFLAEQGGVALGNGMGAHFVSGTGTTLPLGIMEAATAGKTLAVDAEGDTLVSDDLIDLYHSVVSGYRRNGSWLMKDSTLAVVRKMKDGNEQYLWQPGLSAGSPDSILGRPVFTDPAVDAVAAAKNIVGFGDISKYYVRLAGPVRIERSDDFAFSTDLVTFRFIVRADGNLVDTGAFKVIATGAAA